MEHKCKAEGITVFDIDNGIVIQASAASEDMAMYVYYHDDYGHFIGDDDMYSIEVRFCPFCGESLCDSQTPKPGTSGSTD